MNFLRLISGFLLSFVFLYFFAYAISDLRWFFDNFFASQSEAAFLGSVSGVLQDSVAEKVVDDDLNIKAQSAVSVLTGFDGTDKVLLSKNEQRKLSIASISKLMTAVVAMENLSSSQEITISNQAVSQSNNPEPLKPGETFYVKDLLRAMLVGSDNAASYALCEAIGLDKCIGLMNAKAEELELSDTSFLNPSGLGLANFSTAQDLVKFTRYLLDKGISILEITRVPEFDLFSVDRKISHKIISTDELLTVSSSLTERIVGGKTGETRTANGCLLLILNSPDKQGFLINVVLNSNDRFGEMKKIINWVDASYLWR